MRQRSASRARVLALFMHLDLISRWLERRYLPILHWSALSSIGLSEAMQRRTELAPFRFATLIFMTA